MKKKYLTLEISIDDTNDSKECLKEMVDELMGHMYVCDGTLDIKVIKVRCD